MPKEPDKVIATAMAEEVLVGPAHVSRFSTGHRHFVFGATSDKDRAVVVRISRREDLRVAQNSLYWSDRLRPLGIPLPKVLHADLTMERHPFPFVILERLTGRDLGFVVDSLPNDELRGMARRLADLQAIVAGLGPGRGYGFSPRLEGPFPHADWGDVIAASLSRSRKRIRGVDIINEDQVDRVEIASDGLKAYFAGVQPTPFLHDITTKNVIVDDTRLSGIVDVDDLCFGDPLFLVGLIRAALLANGHNANYADAWIEVLRPNEAQRTALIFYTAIFCLDFMSELGQRFNRAEAAPVEAAHAEHLHGLLDRYLAELTTATQNGSRLPK